MAKELMNEAERFLLQHWEEARLMEESMEAVRNKYKEVFQRIVDAVTEAHPELDASAVYATQFWGQGYIGFGRKSWPGGDTNWPSGLWMSNIRLENLATENSDQPSATIEISSKVKKGNFDTAAAKAELTTATQELFSPDELDRANKSDTGNVLLRFAAPSKSELMAMLADGDGQQFVARFVAQFDLMAKLIPVLDKIFQQFTASKP